MAATDAAPGGTTGVFSPDLPPARFVHLDGRGDLLVRHIAGPPGAPAIALLHGWTATADLNWYRSYRRLGERYEVFAFDHRGHGSGLRAKTSFRLEDCADDVVDVATELGIDEFIPVGYSMGGTIAQLVWRQHPERVQGLVLAATAPLFTGSRDERLSFMGLTGLAALARYTPQQARRWLTDQLYLQRKSAQWEPWAIEEAASHDWRTVLEAGRAIGGFSSLDWLPDVDVPASVVVTMSDRVVPLRRQTRLFDLIPDAQAFRVDADHDAAIASADRFVPVLLRAIESARSRA